MDATCGRRVFSSAETPCNFIIYANERKVTTKLLLNSRNFLWVSLCYKHTIKKPMNTLKDCLTKRHLLAALSHCVTAHSTLLFLSGGTVVLHGFTARYQMVWWSKVSSFFSSLLLFHIFLRITCKCITGVGHCI